MKEITIPKSKAGRKFGSKYSIDSLEVGQFHRIGYPLSMTYYNRTRKPKRFVVRKIDGGGYGVFRVR